MQYKLPCKNLNFNDNALRSVLNEKRGCLANNVKNTRTHSGSSLSYCKCKAISRFRARAALTNTRVLVCLRYDRINFI